MTSYKDRIMKLLVGNVFEDWKFELADALKCEESKESIISAFQLAYEKDTLAEFYSAIRDKLISNDETDQIAECNIMDMGGNTDVILHLAHSTTLVYSFITANGTDTAAFSTETMFKITSIDKVDNILEDFTALCYEVYTCFDEFTIEEVEEAGSTIMVSVDEELLGNIRNV